MKYASVRCGVGSSPWLPDTMKAMSRSRASDAAASARASVVSVGPPSSSTPAPSTTAISLKSATVRVFSVMRGRRRS
jgi:hypothetical protein